MAHSNLGSALWQQGQLPEAVAACKEAIRLQPDFAAAHTMLGHALKGQGKLSDAVAAYHEAIRLEPREAIAHNGLGNALRAQGKSPEAIAAFKEAIRLKPDYAYAHNNLGTALEDQGKLPEAVASYKEAIHLKPDYATAHINLGGALRQQGKLPEAVAAYKEAIRLQPHDAVAHSNLGNVLLDQGKVSEAITAYKEAIRLKPDFAGAHHNLGVALTRDPGKLPEAIAAFKEAIRLKPDDAMAHCNLGLTLVRQGDFAAGVTAVRRGHELGSKDPAWTRPSAQWLREAERMVELDSKLPAVLRGETKPGSAAEQLEFALLCHHKQLYVASARFFSDAFAAEPKLTDDLRSAKRYSAACVAALAGCGKGQDAAKLSEKEGGRWREQARAWLRADLALWTNELEKNTPKARTDVQRMLQHWQRDPDFAGLRDPEALAKLPEAERQAWQKLWADVDALLKRAQEPE
jgi:tetratricopeptide (TPR) repeat protein